MKRQQFIQDFWFYIPTEFYLDGKIGVEIQNSLDDKGVTLETPKSEIQKLILEWCTTTL